MKVAFTVCTSNYLAQAKTLGDSILRYNPEYTFFIGLLDPLPESIDPGFVFPHSLVGVDKLEMPWLQEMIERYSTFELSCALKPFYAEYFLKAYKDVGSVLFFDSDIFVYHSLSELDPLLDNYNIVLTPHFFTPLYDGLDLSEKHILNAGIYNGGFFAIKPSEETFSFLDWWKSKLRKECLVDFANGLCVDQMWLNFVPLYFNKVHILKDLGYNVAYWNLHERKIKISEKGTFINEKSPLVFFHFSGFNPEFPDSISRFQNRFEFKDINGLKGLFEEYCTQLMLNDYGHLSKIGDYYAQAKLIFQQEADSQSNSVKPGERKFISLLKRAYRKIKHIP